MAIFIRICGFIDELHASPTSFASRSLYMGVATVLKVVNGKW